MGRVLSVVLFGAAGYGVGATIRGAACRVLARVLAQILSSVLGRLVCRVQCAVAVRILLSAAARATLAEVWDAEARVLCRVPGEVPLPSPSSAARPRASRRAGAVGWCGLVVAASLACWAASRMGLMGRMGRMGCAVERTIRRRCARTRPRSRPWLAYDSVLCSVVGRGAG